MHWFKCNLHLGLCCFRCVLDQVQRVPRHTPLMAHVPIESVQQQCMLQPFICSRVDLLL